MQGGFDVIHCVKCSLLLHRKNIRSMEDTSIAGGKWKCWHLIVLVVEDEKEKVDVLLL